MDDIRNKTVAVLGGDTRMCRVAEKLSGVFTNVRVFLPSDAVRSGIECVENLDDAIVGSDILVLPLPLTRDNKTLFVHGAVGREVMLGDILSLAKRHGVAKIFCGNPTREFSDMAREYGISLIDYYLDERLISDNAVPTAEGAIMLTMQELPVTIRGLECAVLGYGRVGGALARLLSALGASVTVAARREEVLCEACGEGFNTCGFERSKLADLFLRCRIVYNTVPARIIPDGIFQAMSERGQGCVFMELASRPGGFDPHAAEAFGQRVISAPGLPGKYAPESAGDYIFNSIIRAMEKEEII